MLVQVWFLLGFYCAIAVIPLSAVGLVLLAGLPAANRKHPRARRVLWSLLLGFSALAISLGIWVELTVD